MMNPIPPPYSHMSYGGGSGAYVNSNSPGTNANAAPNVNANAPGAAQRGPPDYFSTTTTTNGNAGISGPLPSFNAMDNNHQYQHQQQHQQQQQHHQQNAGHSAPTAPPPSNGIGGLNFDILAWHPAYQSCQRFFLDHAQHEPATQAVCALINIRLPFQWHSPISSSQPSNGPSNGGAPNFNFNAYGRNTNHSPMGRPQPNTSSWVSPVPYIRRLVVTGFDNPAILHGFFGDDYIKGVMPLVECERRNYLFAAKHGGWRSCKKQYDTGSGGGNGDDESLPFMMPMGRVVGEELDAADREWSKWLAFEDWMVGPRAVEEEDAREGKKHAREHLNTQAQERGGAGFGVVKQEEGADVHDGGADGRMNSGMMHGYGSR